MKTQEVDRRNKAMSRLARDAAKGPVILTEDGRPVAAVVPMSDFDMENLSLSTNSDFLNMLKRSRARLKAEGGISSEEMRRRLGVPGRG